MAKGKSNKPPPERVVENRRSRFDYEILETLECGMILHGSEVKSVRAGAVSLAEGYVRVQQGQTTPRRIDPGLFLHNVHIAEYGPAGPQGNSRQHRPERVRALLAHKGEIAKLARMVQQKGMTIVPIRLYFKNGYAKLLIGIGTGRARHDKRHVIGERESKRDIARAMSRKM